MVKHWEEALLLVLLFSCVWCLVFVVCLFGFCLVGWFYLNPSIFLEVTAVFIIMGNISL